MADEGIVEKYEVKRLNDVTGKHDDCKYFVLDPQHDTIARMAMHMYADEAYRRGQAALAEDIDNWLLDFYQGVSE